MTNPRRRAAALLAAGAVLATGLATSTVLTPAAPATAAARVTARLTATAGARASAVSVTVLSVNPSTPAITSTAKPLVITVSLENTTDQAVTGVTLAAERGDPITTQDALTSSLADTSARSGGRAIQPTRDPEVTLPPGAPVTATFTTTTSIQDDHLHICQCANAVYPIDVTARTTTTAGVAEVLGGARTYLSSFDAQPTRKLAVTWVWPLIDRPHRTADGTVFTDDDLTASVSSGGRLDRALQVVQDVDDAVPLTLVVDPDLVDELQIMATRPYTVRAADATSVPGTGQQAAAAWLARLRTVLTPPSLVRIEFTALGDPDVTGLTQNHQTWSAQLSAEILTRVTAALGGLAPTSTLAWPSTGSATVATLDALVAAGTGTVVLDGSRVRPSTRSGIPVSAARLRTSHRTVDALLTSPTLQRYALSVLAGSTAALPELTSELAVRVTQRPNTAQSAVLSAPRYVDPPSPTIAAQAITATSSSLFSQPVTAAAVTAALPASTPTSSVRAVRASSAGLPDAQLDKLAAVAKYRPAVQSLIKASAAGQRILAALPDAVQRSESAAWSSAGSAIGGGPTNGIRRSTALVTQLTGYLGQVRILNPPESSYTLASSNSPLLISVRNESALSMTVIVSVATVGGLPGLTQRDLKPVVVGPRSKTSIKILTRIQRSGRIPVQAKLRTPSGFGLGSPVRLFVHSTVLGTIGVVITISAGVVLVLALLVRYVRRVLRIRAKRAQAGTAS